FRLLSPAHASAYRCYVHAFPTRRSSDLIVEYGTPTYSIIINAAAPIKGGIICPPVDAEASVAAANSGLNPAFFIIGMVKEPEATVFPTELPETIPCSALA